MLSRPGARALSGRTKLPQVHSQVNFSHYLLPRARLGIPSWRDAVSCPAEGPAVRSIPPTVRSFRTDAPGDSSRSLAQIDGSAVLRPTQKISALIHFH